ncbi:inner membrane ABC transporter permease protein YdcV [mine drainage metagenome]|uniref:Inner membrane ABC transporter permease protein YdcV n=1 Tax=mine drainage metagenome TaxID=410659 RepID=A0A1J5PY90_9ZZZZ
MATKTPSKVHKSRVWVRDHLILLVGILVLCYMFLPVFVVMALSFNEPKSRLTYTFDKFTFNNWLHPCAVSDMCTAVGTSLKIGLLATIGATFIGTLMAFALVRHRFKGRAFTNLLVFIPMASPEVVMGSSLLTLFVAIKFPLGFWTILIAHIMFCISFVVVTVKARLAGLDPRLEQAAMDLYADEWQTFRRITLPLVMPGIVSAALLAFSLSFDDFIVTNFNSGSTVTFPMFVWGASQRGIPPQVNVIGTAMFLFALSMVLISQLLGNRRKRRLA